MIYDGIEIELWECSNDGTIDGKFEVFLLGACIRWLLRLGIGTNEVSEISLRDEIYIETILGVLDGILLGTCDVTVLRSLEGLIDGALVSNDLCLCCCRGYVHM